MTSALICLALALVLAPVSAARRRFGKFFITPTHTRKSQVNFIIRIVGGCVVGAALMFGTGAFMAACVLASTIVVRVRRADQDRRRTCERGHLLDALETVIGELRVGAHPSAAADTAAGEARGESAMAFAIGAARGKLGGSAAEGLRSTDSVVTEELSRVADAWHVAEQYGLALAELLAATRTDLIGRIRFRARTDAALAGARASASVLAGLPLLGVGLGQLMGAAPLHVLFGSSVGSILLPVGATFVCVGLLWTDAITRKVLT